MDPLEFLSVARNLEGSDHESQRRTSIGRSYFALFNHVRTRLAPLKRLPETEDAHALVARYLTSANNRGLHSVGRTLKDLRESRNTADYDMEATIAQDQSRLALSRAERAVKEFRGVNEASFAAAMNAQPTYRREPETR